MEKRLDDIYKQIQESLLPGKAKLDNNNDDDNDKKYEERNTIKYMFLNPRQVMSDVLAKLAGGGRFDTNPLSGLAR